jgi:hypothetical protein
MLRPQELKDLASSCFQNHKALAGPEPWFPQGPERLIGNRPSQLQVGVSGQVH